MKKIVFIFFGRLTEEKGCDALLECRKNIWLSDFSDRCLLHVFGDGDFSWAFVQLAQGSDCVSFHGWQWYDILIDCLKGADYCLMPSRFLETFGLTALESLSHGVPVIWIQHGGLKPFVMDELDLWKHWKLDHEWMTLSWSLYHQIESCIKSVDQDLWVQWSKWARKVSCDFGEKEWLDCFLSQTGWSDVYGKNILLVSDYVTVLWGIETYLYKVQTLLEKQWAKVVILGARVHRGVLWTLERWLGLLWSICNIPFALLLGMCVKKMKPDLVWYHSTLRFVGWFPIWWVGVRRRKKGSTDLSPRKVSGRKIAGQEGQRWKSWTMQTWMMYHDLWYFHPFPSRVYEEKDIAQSLSLNSFVWSGLACFPSFFGRLFVLLSVPCKYFLLKLLHKVLAQFVDKHLVPSGFMLEYVKRFQQHERVVVLPHFLEKE